MGGFNAPPVDPFWLNTGESLDSWLDTLSSGLPLGIDSEFERTSTFYPIPGLVQISAGEDVRLVEPSAVAASHRFPALLEDPDRVKLLYAMSEDLELFREWLGVTACGVIDLQIAGAFCGYGLSAGYVTVVNELMGVALSKDETRSDWLKRPLSLAQQQYAMADVYYLQPLYERFVEQLEAKGFLEAMREETAQACTRMATREDPQSYYLKVRSAWRLSKGRQAVLRALCDWRESRCRELDRPRNRVVGDPVLVSIAEALPRNRQSLAAIPGIPPGVVRRDGEALLAVIDNVINGEHRPVEPIPPPLSKKEQQRYRSVKAVIRDVAETAGLPLELIASRRYLEPAVREGLKTGSIPSFLKTGWRAQLLGQRQKEMESILNE
ncbi:ribonuclease D [Halospina denitrificans]|uniref:Ribonuclease D n=1 Tax=Halospina denitrificans TaxID=332522 RepID=A0A4R7JTE2_9GAMM|nr:HRDC domain-containing protein [Halospina denitrificans]TDT41582.1 ribonuclease D [Halospina denitrificans]